MKYWNKAWSLVDQCSWVSDACTNCWLRSMNKRFGKAWNGHVTPNEQNLNIPMKIKAIRRIYAAGIMKQKQLAQMYGTTFQTISRIVRGESRKKQKGIVANYTHLRQRTQRHRNSKGQFQPV